MGAAALTRTVCRNLPVALDRLAAEGHEIRPILVSRSDSTLRGHYPVETDVIAAELEAFDAHFLVPAFFEGGRVTTDSTHYLMVEGRRVPVHETEFARDSVFDRISNWPRERGRAAQPQPYPHGIRVTAPGSQPRDPRACLG